MKKITILLALLFYLGLQVANAQEKVVTGKVTSAKEGYALPGVTVVVKGTQIGVSTDKNNDFIRYNNITNITFSNHSLV